jgi:hypothetical protein
MAKKSTVKEGYLEDKLKSLLEQQTKVESILNQYNELWIKLQGAIEVTRKMVEETAEPEIKQDENK